MFQQRCERWGARIAFALFALSPADVAFAGAEPSESLILTDLRASVGVACEVVTETPCMGVGWKLQDAAGRMFAGYGVQRNAGQHFIFRVPDAAVGTAAFSVRMEDGKGGAWVEDGKASEWKSVDVVCREQGVAPAVGIGCGVDAQTPVIAQGPLRGWIRGDRSEFAVGEKIEFCFSVPTNAAKVALYRFGDDLVEERYAVDAVTDAGIVLATQLAKPGVVSVELSCDRGALTLSAVVGFDAIRGATAGRPADFDDYWAGLRAQAKASVVNAEVTPWKAGRSGFTVTVPCGAKAPMTAGFSVRADAAPKSCTARLTFPGYNPMHASSVPSASQGLIVLDFNPHGSPLGRKPEFYARFAETNRIQSYGFERELNADRETSYFHDMSLRLLTALEFVKTLPQWNGRIEVVGGSQGGFLALLAAANEPAVKKVDAVMPWLCDFDSGRAGYRGGWHPYYTDAMAYYFPLYHLPNVRAEQVVLTAGLADTTCTPYGIIAAYHALGCPKTLHLLQGVGHCGSSRNPRLDVTHR